MWRRCRVSYVPSSWYWLIVVASKGRGEMFYSFSFFTFFLFFFLPCPSLSSPLSLLSLFSLSLGDDTKWPTRVDMSLNPNTINKKSVSEGWWMSVVWPNVVQTLVFFCSSFRLSLSPLHCFISFVVICVLLLSFIDVIKDPMWTEHIFVIWSCFRVNPCHARSSCSKLKMSSVNLLLKLWSLSMAYTLIFFAEACAKATHIFLAKISVNLILYCE